MYNSQTLRSKGVGGKFLDTTIRETVTASST